MRLDKNQEYYQTAIRNCERNIGYVENSNFSPKEKIELKISYQTQIRHYKRKLMSFSKPVNQ